MISELARQGKHLLLLLGFLTTLPVPRRLWPRETLSLSDALPLAPLIGALLGTLSAAAYYLAHLFVGSTAAAWIALACSILCGWSLHLDGFSDLADGLGSHKEGAAMRAVMKDSHLGGFGAVALVVALGLWTSLVASMEPASAMRALFLSALAGRFGLCLAAWLGKYPWEAGLGREIVRSFSTGHLLLALAATGLFLPLAPRLWVLSVLASCLAASSLVALAERRLGGTNGDVLGACEVAGELAALLLCAALG